ncbi:cytochrome c [Coraliomargarita sp. SDUM461003]|uniref:Cytochrome c n=1 Tax=Thalassobacterium maritimum TaxID=3041265 RepID=A0ABU1AXQ7_9BACT|nr:cytochrome c [Coraliomargarita sp. SDUM461003]MDQ8208397.1 cytochrome c [Coraliomargarita sp. SDUM461003]
MSEQPHNSSSNSNSREALEKAAMQDEHMQDVHAQLMREKEEPHEGFSPVPIFLMFVFAALCFWGGVYLVEYSGNFQANAFSPHFDPNASAPKPVEISLYDRGAKVFRNQCAACHQAEGTGVPGVYPPLEGSTWVTGHPEVVSRILINGLNGKIEVKGNSYNGNMPAFGPSGLALSEKDLAGVITFIRQSWGNDASEVTEQMIADYSANYSARSTPWTAAELKEGLGPIPEAAPAE